MKKINNQFVLRKQLRDQSYNDQRQIVDSYLRLAEIGDWAQIQQHFGLDRKDR
ncbi:MAG: hypothetical protein K6A14_03700 [Erysipelotrichaceae bacterium]|nr:hypothetical protein [Erysipelotrichaceae bacterium]